MNQECPNCGHEYDKEIAPGLKNACPKCMADFLMLETGELETVDYSSDPSYDEPPFKPGDKLGEMEIEEFLGQGGMGFVYKAKQAQLDRMVALKILKPRLASSKEFTERFNREARALAKLSHPNIVQVFESGKIDEHYYLAMEYIDGASLRQILATKKLEPKKALEYVPQICDALEYAHAQQVIHRDIKPENIMIDKQGNLKITDFGLAKIVSGKGKSQSMATVTGQVMGTVNYMAPEQVGGMSDVDHRADIYSLGVVFYEMLTGELPLGRFPNPSECVKVDVYLDEVVLKALESNPERRYQNASEIKSDVFDKKTTSSKRQGIPKDRRRALKGRLSRMAVLGALGVPLTIIGAFVTASMGRFLFEPHSKNTAMFITVVSNIIFLSAIILSIIAWVRISNSNGELRGKGFAIFGVFFPVGLLGLLLLLAIPFFLLNEVEEITEPVSSQEINFVSTWQSVKNKKFKLEIKDNKEVTFYDKDSVISGTWQSIGFNKLRLKRINTNEKLETLELRYLAEDLLELSDARGNKQVILSRIK